MPTYNNPINFGSGLKIGQGVPVDDRMIFDDLLSANTFLATNSFFLYEGFWAYVLDPGEYIVYQRVNPALAWNAISNAYVWKSYSALIGGLPVLGNPGQQLVVNSLGSASEWAYTNSPGLIRFIGAALTNPGVTAGMFVRQTSGTNFSDMHVLTNYPLNASNRLPIYFIFTIDGNDLIAGKQGIFNAPNHQLTQREPLFLRGSFVTSELTYFTNVLSPVSNTVSGQFNLIVGNAIDSDNIFIDLTRDWTIVGSVAPGTGNANIARATIQQAGAGGIPEDPDGFFTVPHGFGNQQGIVQIVALNVTPPPYVGGSGNVLITADTIAYENGAVRIKLDYGVVSASLIFQVILIF